MEIPDSVPSLAKLIDPKTQWNNKCHWQSKARGKQNAHRCKNPISVDSVQLRREHVQALRRLTASITSQTDTSSNAAKSNDTSRIPEILTELSQLLLCKKSHRGHSVEIYTKWSKEFEEVGSLKSRPATENIREKLKIGDGNRLSCLGKAKTGERCKNWISSKNRKCAEAIISSVKKARDSSGNTKNLLIVLSQLLMCQRWHQVQASAQSEEWFRIIQGLYPPTNSHPEQRSHPTQRSTPLFKRTITTDRETPQSAASSFWSNADSVTGSTPATSPTSFRRYGSTTTPFASPLFSRNATTTNITENVQPQRADHNRTTRNTARQYEQGFLPPAPTLPDFELHSPNKSKTIVKDLYTKIKRSIIPKEKPPGYIYGFQRKGEKLIKIGFTTQSVRTRMRQWERLCNQKVVVVLEEHMLHAAKVETLVHLSLYHERRREVRCNGGKGCEKRHCEWFEVSLERVKRIIDLWKKWIETRPYDEEGNLKLTWVKHIDLLRVKNVTTLGDIWRDWIDITVLAEGTTIKIKEEKVDDEKTIAKEKTEIIVTNTEVKDEFIVEIAAHIQELSKLSRGFTESITELKDETPEERPLTEYPMAVQDLSHHLDDPFVDSTITVAAS